MHPLSEEVEALQHMLVSQATGGNEDDATYLKLRRTILDDPALAARVPRFVSTCRSLSQFWQFIKTSTAPMPSAEPTCGTSSVRFWNPSKKEVRHQQTMWLLVQSSGSILSM